MKILVTGAAGFIGAAVSSALLKRGDQVIGLDSLNDFQSIKNVENRQKTITKTFLPKSYLTNQNCKKGK